MEITSINNQKVKYWQKLNNKKYRDLEHLFLVEDEHLVNEALKFGEVKEIITVDNEKEYEVPTFYVNDKIMKSISSQVTSAKVIAVCKMPDIKNINDNIIILDRLQDPGNLGTIIRSAVAFNFKNIVLSEDSVDLYNSKVIRASEGMIFHVNVVRNNLKDFINNLDKEYTLITTDVKSGRQIKDIKFKKCAIVIGCEGSGVSENIASICEEKVYIPINKNCESLNAGVACSILMYEVNNG